MPIIITALEKVCEGIDKMVEGDWTRMPGRAHTESLSLKNN